VEKDRQEVETDLQDAELGSGADRVFGAAGMVREGARGAEIRGKRRVGLAGFGGFVMLCLTMSCCDQYC